MNALIEHQIITDTNGNPEYAIIPYNVFSELSKQYTDDESLTVPHEVVSASVDGDSMIKAWREHLGLTQQVLADQIGISQPTLAKLEKADANPRKSTLKRIADAMGIKLTQLDV